ncbi:MAG: MBL fold metallo-hydrolase, partial [Candidatus Tectomicrobia bacterium]|nr:MBL fold metallo-hydrolase [Candidatus Tectomicrobia bacterium]
MVLSRVECHGGVGDVTGNCFLLDLCGTKILVDCGMFRGRAEVERRNYAPFPFDPREIKYLFLTHAHLDHIGLLPKLVREGFLGEIIATGPTVDLSLMMLLDAAHTQEREEQRQETPPLFTFSDVERCYALFTKVAYDDVLPLGAGIAARLRHAGHILGSAIIEISGRQGMKKVKLVFSGDLGGGQRPIVHDAAVIKAADGVFLESTYGDRLHKSLDETLEEFQTILRDTFQRRGNVIIPAFAIGRAQEILYLVNELCRNGKLSRPKIYIDSSCATEATKTFARYPQCLNREAIRRLTQTGIPKRLPLITFAENLEASRAIGKVTGGAIIIAGSEMCEAGRIQYHLKQHLPRSQSSVIFIGYQAEGTLGRELVSGAKSVPIFDEEVPVHANIHILERLSAHADQKGLLNWLGHFTNRDLQVVIVHGEERNALK